jgi:hypothetical protein
MKYIFLLVLWNVGLVVLGQSSVLIEPSNTNGIFAKHDSAVYTPIAVFSLPDSSEGTRLMWIPGQSALRAGTVTGLQWAPYNVGLWSVATGFDAMATGEATTSIGVGTTAQAKSSVALGMYNVVAGDKYNHIANDPILAVGNGFHSGNRNNALTVLKNANVGLNTATPYYPLTFKSILGDKISFWGGTATNNSNHYGIGIQDFMFQLFTPTSDDDIVLGTGRSGAFAENVRFKGNGRVGIGLNNPNEILDVNGRMRIRHQTYSAGVWMNNSANSLNGADGAFFGMKTDVEAGIWIGNNWRLWVNNTGVVSAAGGISIGEGETIAKVIRKQVATNLLPVAPGVEIVFNVPVLGVAIGDHVVFNPSAVLGSLTVRQVVVDVPNAVTLVLANDTYATIDPPNALFHFLIFK